MVTLIRKKLVNSAILDLIGESQSVFGYLKELPSMEMVNALRKVDYAGHIILSSAAYTELSDLTDENSENYDESWVDAEDMDGIATVGGWAVDNLNNHEYRDIKRMFTLFGTLDPRKGDPVSDSFLVGANVTERGIYPEKAIAFISDRDRVETVSAGAAFSDFREYKKARGFSM